MVASRLFAGYGPVGPQARRAARGMVPKSPSEPAVRPASSRVVYPCTVDHSDSATRSKGPESAPFSIAALSGPISAMNDKAQEIGTVGRNETAEDRWMGINGTPSFFMGTRVVSGAQPLETFQQIIAQEKAKAG